jgi:large subunit ribosomal protein L15
MKLHDLQPAPGSRKPRTRVGRGIAAGKGKTAGRGTKGQKARAGGGIPAWFEGGQTPLHMRIPKLKGFKNRFKIEYEVVNVGAIGALADRGAFEFEDTKNPSKSAPITVNQDILRAVGLVRTLNKPLKILGAGELSLPLFVVADAFTASARAKIEAAGGVVNVLEVPSSPLAALGVTPETAAPEKAARPKAAKADAAEPVVDADEPEAAAQTVASEAEAAEADDAEPAAKGGKATSEKPASAKTPTAKVSSDKAAAKPATKVAKASASAEEPATSDEPAPADEAAPADDATTAEDTSADASSAADDTEQSSGDDA